MKKLFLTWMFFLSVAESSATAQSPALDPNYVILQPTETFKGEWKGTGVGAIINNVGIMSPTSQYGDVFLNCIDTFGYGSDIGSIQPLGLFQGGDGFSLFNRSLMTLDGIGYCQKVYFRGKEKPPDLISGNYWLPSQDWLKFDISNHIVLSTVSDSEWNAGQTMHENTLSAPLRNSEKSYDDVIAIGEKILSSTGRVNLEYYAGNMNPYHGEKFGVDSFKVISASKEWILRYPANSLQALDIDRDGVTDVLFLTDNNFLGIAFGKINKDSIWGVDTILYYYLPYKATSFLLMDFLWSDGIPDLILQSSDTIYCYSGANKFLKIAPDWLHPDLAIPSPAHLDPHNFNRDGNGGFNWHNLFDAGNINGSGDHSLVTLADYYPLSGSLNFITYAFFYSGGKAADEKADAIMANNESIYSAYDTFDTIQGSLTSPMNFLIGDPSNTAGGTGRIDFVKGSYNIPHNPDPRWMKGVLNSNFNSSLMIALIQNPVRDIATINIQSEGWQDGQLTVHDLLGRSVLSKKIYKMGSQTNIDLNMTSLTDGVYTIEFSSGSTARSTRCILIH